MDARLFRLPTHPNFYAKASTADPFNTNQRQKYSELPTPDSRFPGWAAPMSDGRLVTSYQNHCSQNIPSGQQHATKAWMTHHALDIIQLTRDRAAANAGAGMGLDPSVVPPPALVVDCTRSDCTRTYTNIEGGIGSERAPEEVPELFGTWDARTIGVSPRPNTAINSNYEGGRNTPRGGDAQELR